MVLEKGKERIKQRTVKGKRVTDQRTRVQGRDLRMARGQKGTKRKPIATTFLHRMDVLVEVNVVFGMIVWIHQAGDVSDVGRKIIVHWSAGGQNVNRDRDLAVVEVRRMEKH